MTDPHWPFPSLKYPLTPPKPPEYSDYSIKVSTEVKGDLTSQSYKTKVVTEDALL